MIFPVGSWIGRACVELILLFFDQRLIGADRSQLVLAALLADLVGFAGGDSLATRFLLRCGDFQPGDLRVAGLDFLHCLLCHDPVRLGRSGDCCYHARHKIDPLLFRTSFSRMPGVSEEFLNSSEEQYPAHRLDAVTYAGRDPLWDAGRNASQNCPMT